jgi:glycosyltransferase involved in cell wall biosynthesis
MGYEYTIAVQNLNKGRTIERSLRSILDQIDDRFEVVVVDDGSTDNSLDILDKLADEYENLRYYVEDNNNLAEARNSTFEKASAEFIVFPLDTDDQYDDGIIDFVEVYRQIEQQVNFEFFLNGDGINVVSRDVLLDVPHRSLGYGEDKDLWRRIAAKYEIIWIDHEPFRHQIGYSRDLWERMKVTFEESVVQLRSGVPLRSYLNWYFSTLHRDDGVDQNIHPKLAVFKLLVGVPAYLMAWRRGLYTPPSAYARMGEVEKERYEHTLTLSEIEQEYGIEINRDKLSPAGRRIFNDVNQAEATPSHSR